MVNGINGGCLNLHPENNIKEDPDIQQGKKTEAEMPISEGELELREEEERHEAKIRAKELAYLSSWVKDVKYVWRRKNCGTYPKWFANISKKVLRFVFRHFTHHKIEFVLRGRGCRTVKGINSLGFRQDLPLRYAKKVAVYVSIYRR